MAKYAPHPDALHCDECGVYLREEELIPSKFGIHADSPGAYCPNCKLTMWCYISILGHTHGKRKKQLVQVQRFRFVDNEGLVAEVDWIHETF